MITVAEAESRFRDADPTNKFKRWKPSQRDALDLWQQRRDQRMLLYYPTGEGKSKVALAALAVSGYEKAIVIAPPKTQARWKEDARTLGLELVIMSVQKFREPATKLLRGVPIIVDEFHQLGRNTGKGFRKLDRMAAGFPAIILCSATPNYNDAERVYCVGHVLDPSSFSGGYLSWLYENCVTKTNPFASVPYVEGFKNYNSASHFLSSLPYTAYVEDTAEWTTLDLYVQLSDDAITELSLLEEYGLSARSHRIMASQMEELHQRKRLALLTPDESALRPEVLEALVRFMDNREETKFLIYSDNKEVAKAAYKSLTFTPYQSNLITGDSTGQQAERVKQIFIHLNIPSVLIGTSALATGVDEIDKVCNHLIILDDTPDSSLRRQLIGRVLPRGDYERETIVTMLAIHT